MSDDATPAAAQVQGPPQFGLGALLGCFVALAMALSYLRQFDSVLVFRNGMFVLLLAAFWGVLLGGLTMRLTETTFWSVVVAAAGYLSVVGETHYGSGFHFAWSTVGAAAGGMAAVPKRLVLRIAAGGLAGALPMTIYFALVSERAELAFDLVAAVIVGGLIGVLIEIITWLEGRSRIPRYVTASWLLCAVIIGNLLVPLVRA